MALTSTGDLKPLALRQQAAILALVNHPMTRKQIAFAANRHVTVVHHYLTRLVAEGKLVRHLDDGMYWYSRLGRIT